MKGVVVVLVLLLACNRTPPVYTQWTEANAGPPGVPAALKIIAANAPCPKPVGGAITWRDGPFDCGQIKSAGCFLYTATPPRVELMRFALVEETALAHEIGHAYWAACYGRFGEGEPDFMAWVSAVNSAIRGATP